MPSMVRQYYSKDGADSDPYQLLYKLSAAYLNKHEHRLLFQELTLTSGLPAFSPNNWQYTTDRRQCAERSSRTRHWSAPEFDHTLYATFKNHPLLETMNMRSLDEPDAEYSVDNDQGMPDDGVDNMTRRMGKARVSSTSRSASRAVKVRSTPPPPERALSTKTISFPGGDLGGRSGGGSGLGSGGSYGAPARYLEASVQTHLSARVDQNYLGLQLALGEDRPTDDGTTRVRWLHARLGPIQSVRDIAHISLSLDYESGGGARELEPLLSGSLSRPCLPLKWRTSCFTLR